MKRQLIAGLAISLLASAPVFCTEQQWRHWSCGYLSEPVGSDYDYDYDG
jgi:hypothetical protein